MYLFYARFYARAHKKSPVFWGFFVGGKKATAYSPGSYPSTIGAGRLNFSVRDGKRCGPAATVTLISSSVHFFFDMLPAEET